MVQYQCKWFEKKYDFVFICHSFHGCIHEPNWDYTYNCHNAHKIMNVHYYARSKEDVWNELHHEVNKL